MSTPRWRAPDSKFFFVHKGFTPDVALICKHDHYLKTVKGYTLQGLPGKRKLVPPSEPPPATEEPAGDDTRPSTSRAGLQRARATLQGVIDRLTQQPDLGIT